MRADHSPYKRAGSFSYSQVTIPCCVTRISVTDLASTFYRIASRAF